VRTLRRWLRRIAGVFPSDRAERELAAELDSHLQFHVDDQIRAGMTNEEARRRAVIALGGLEATKDRYRDRRGIPPIDALRQDGCWGLGARDWGLHASCWPLAARISSSRI
jgi:macrolide transport system ATP-binding/permease protein